MTDAEKTMREEQWMLSAELLLTPSFVPEPPIVTAFRLLDGMKWEQFRDSLVDNPALRFFNPELREFSCASGWEDLADEYGVPEYAECWRIDVSMPEAARRFCRDLRALVGSEETADRTVRYFQPICRGRLVLSVNHTTNCLTPYFQDEDDSRFRVTTDMLKHRGLTRCRLTGGITLINA